MRKDSAKKSIFAVLTAAVLTSTMVLTLLQTAVPAFAAGDSPAAAVSDAELTEPDREPEQEPAGKAVEEPADTPAEAQVPDPESGEQATPAGESGSTPEAVSGSGETAVPASEPDENGEGTGRPDDPSEAAQTELTAVEEAEAVNTAAEAQGEIRYIDENGEEKTVAQYIDVSSVNVTAPVLAGTNTWYVVTRNTTFDNPVRIWGSVNLILCDDTELIAGKGIIVADDYSLTIYAQSTENKGKLTAAGGSGQAGIGGSDDDNGKIIINGGTISASGGDNAAGIGGGDEGSGGTITINGGVIQAQGGTDGAGIGGGEHGSSGTITIRKRAVIQQAQGGSGGAGIGGGWKGSGTKITISGGTVEQALGGQSAAGIGGGEKGDGGTINISGGTIRLARGSDGEDGSGGGAGIGGGAGEYDKNIGNGGTITIKGGTVEQALGGKSAAGIGGGDFSNGGTITISGGKIKKAQGGTNGAGIGGGYDSGSGTVTISGGTIKNALGGQCAAGIGGGWKGSGGTITISGGTIEYAQGGKEDKTKSASGGAGIGGGGNGESGTILIKENANILAALGQNNGAGIGGGGYGDAEEITITGSAVIEEAAGGQFGAGIGSGGYSDDGGTIVISGGTIKAMSGYYAAAIGGGCLSDCDIRITGGDITALASDKATAKGSGIGSGGSAKKTESDTGSILIMGGTIKARGAGGAAIGGGYKRSATVTITGGNITATQNGGGAGIGGGGGDDNYHGGSGGKITISGMNTQVTASGGTYGAGIGGGGASGSGGEITISGGTIIAEGNEFGAGIGGGEHGSGGTITIKGGNIQARGNRGAGIGGGGGWDKDAGKPAFGGAGGEIKISGGQIEAISTAGGAGIGSGLESDGGTIEISGGTITATGREGNASNQRGVVINQGGAGIGGGYKSTGGTITISGGTVNAYALPGEDDIPNGSAAIGGGEGASCGTITISGGKVAADGQNVGLGCGLNGVRAGRDMLVLSYTDDTKAGMSVLASSYNCEALLSGSFSDGYGNSYFGLLTPAEKNAIAGKTIVPGASAVYMDVDGEIRGPVPCEIITADTTRLTDTGTTKGWYAVMSDVTAAGSGLIKGIMVTGNVNLILFDRKNMAVNGNISLNSGSKFTVWAQSAGTDMGTLTSVSSTGAVGSSGGSIIGSGSVIVNGGKITLKAGSGTGINIGDRGLTVNGGSVEAEGSYGITAGSLTVSGGSLAAKGGTGGAGILINSGSGSGKLSFLGGTTEASGRNAVLISGSGSSQVTFGDMAVYSSDAAGAVPVAAADRENTCLTAGYARITQCTHASRNYQDIGGGQHKGVCLYCSSSKTEDHTYENHVCGKCGAEQPNHKITFFANNGTGDKTEQKIYDGEETPLKANSFTWADHEFDGWNTVQAPTSENPGTAYAADARVTLTDNLVLYGQWTETPPPVVKTLKSIAITTPPAKVTYTEDEIFDPAGMVVTATYSDKSKAEVTGYTWRPNGALTTADTTITVRYTEDGVTRSAKQAVTVNEADLVRAFVTRLYRVCLDREPDEAGLNSWAEQLRAGQITGVKAAQGFIFSQEFKNKNYCNRHFVQQLYRAFMGREPDEGGWNNWIGQLESGKTREAVFNGFALSPEFTLLCNDYGITRGGAIGVGKWGTVPTGVCEWEGCGEEDGVTQFVKRLYRVCLDREADAGGLADWTKQLWEHTSTGKKVAYGFVFSAEFRNKNYNNETFVDYMYLAFFDREADAAGKADWVSQLNAGKSREAVFNGFADSREFTNLCAKYGILAR